MAMGTRKKRERQESLWVAKEEIVTTPGNAFYDELNRLLDKYGFDRKVEHLCSRYYRGTLGRPSLSPGEYFRAFLIGYFEGIDSERGLPGGWPIRYRYGSLSDTDWMKRRRTTRRCRARGDYFGYPRTRRCFAGCCEC